MSRLHRHLMQVLIGDIASGRIPAGAALPRETDLAQQFRVSRGVVRECLRGLEERRLISVKHGRGATVCSEEAWDTSNPEVLAVMLEGERGPAILGEYLECRRLLEIEAAGLAAERADERDLVALSDALDRMTATARRAPDNTAAESLYHDADLDFHHAVIAATGNRALARMTEPIHRALAMARRPLARPALRLARSIPEHRRILAAIAAHDAGEARAAMRDHLDTVERYLREYSETLQSDAGAPRRGDDSETLQSDAGAPRRGDEGETLRGDAGATRGA